jgi:hypothetical protein
MAISFSFDGDDVVWAQRFQSPTAYLDTFTSFALQLQHDLG